MLVNTDIIGDYMYRLAPFFADVVSGGSVFVRSERRVMPHSATQKDHIDSGLICTVILAGVQGISADPQQLRHELAASSEAFENREILRAAKLLGLKARAVTSRWERLSKLVLPAIARHKDGHYFVLGKVDDEPRPHPGSHVFPSSSVFIFQISSCTWRTVMCTMRTIWIKNSLVNSIILWRAE